MLLRVVFGWIITLAVAGLTAALLVGPNPDPVKSIYC